MDLAKFACAGGPHYAISYYSPSFDGRYVGFGVSLIDRVRPFAVCA